MTPLDSDNKNDQADPDELSREDNVTLAGNHSQMTTVIKDSQVDEVINIGELDTLSIDKKKIFFLFKDLKQLGLVLFIFVGMILLTGFTYYRIYIFVPEPDEMTGDFNIVIAEFGEIRSEGRIGPSKRTGRFMNALCNYLDTEFNATDFGLDVQISHVRMPTIVEDKQAEELAIKTNADLVLYGSVFFDDDEELGRFTPRFYLSQYKDHKLLDDVIGFNQLEYPIVFDTDFRSEEELTETLNTRAAILVNFTTGLVYANSEMIEAARASFVEAIKHAEQIDPFEGQEALYLMHALTLRKQRNYEAALASLDKALDLNPEYARAYIGVGNDYYELASQAVSENNIEAKALLEDSRKAYNQANTKEDRPRSAHIEEKVSLGLGNVLYLEAKLSPNPWARLHEPIEYYEYVIQRYRGEIEEFQKEDKENGVVKNSGIVRLAANAYFNLGVVENMLDNSEQAIAAFENCVELESSTVFDNKCKEQLETLK